MFERKETKLIVLLAVSFIFVFLRIWRSCDSCFWFDEIFGLHAAGMDVMPLIDFVAKDIIHPPLFYLLLKGSTLIGGDGLIWTRSFSVFFSAASIIPLIFLTRELKLDTLTRVTALFLIAVNGSLIKYAHEVRMYGLFFFLATVSLWLFSRYFFRGKSFWALAAVNVLLVNTHYFGWLLIGAEVAAIAGLQRIKLLRTLMMVLVSAAAFAPWIIKVFTSGVGYGGIEQNIGWIQRPDIASIIEFGFDLLDPFYYQQSSAEPASNYYIVLPLTVLILIAAAAYFSVFDKEENKQRILFLAIVTAFPVVVAFLLSWIMPVSIWGSRHLILVFVPFLVLLSIVLTSVPFRSLRYSILSVWLLLAVISFATYLMRPAPEYIWCKWEELASETSEGEQRNIYVFEDLVAYHTWFAQKGRTDTQITKVVGMPGTHEDTAYFLPRGFTEVRRITPREIDDPQAWALLRTKNQDEFRHIEDYFREIGYDIVSQTRVEVGGELAYLVHIQQKPKPVK